MKRILVLFLLTALCAAPAFAATATMTGRVTDDMCGAKHDGPNEAACIRSCVRSMGAKFALLVDGKLYVLIGMRTELDALAGQKATVTGELRDNTITVSSVQAAK
jgi:hypothetical protein